eukprot:COSAG01_NODE_7392_length_3226_cov_11.354013_4_plen_577_part_01
MNDGGTCNAANSHTIWREGPGWPSARTLGRESRSTCEALCEAMDMCTHYVWLPDNSCIVYATCLGREYVDRTNGTTEGPYVYRRLAREWTMLLRHAAKAPQLESSVTSRHNRGNYFALDYLETHRGTDGMFMMMLVWPQIRQDNQYVWKQMNNPWLQFGVEEYQPISVPNDSFGGLQASGSASLLAAMSVGANLSESPFVVPTVADGSAAMSAVNVSSTSSGENYLQMGTTPVELYVRSNGAMKGPGRGISYHRDCLVGPDVWTCWMDDDDQSPGVGCLQSFDSCPSGLAVATSTISSTDPCVLVEWNYECLAGTSCVGSLTGRWNTSRLRLKSESISRCAASEAYGMTCGILADRLELTDISRLCMSQSMDSSHGRSDGCTCICTALNSTENIRNVSSVTSFHQYSTVVEETMHVDSALGIEQVHVGPSNSSVKVIPATVLGCSNVSVPTASVLFKVTVDQAHISVMGIGAHTGWDIDVYLWCTVSYMPRRMIVRDRQIFDTRSDRLSGRILPDWKTIVWDRGDISRRDSQACTLVGPSNSRDIALLIKGASVMGADGGASSELLPSNDSRTAPLD